MAVSLMEHRCKKVLNKILTNQKKKELINLNANYLGSHLERENNGTLNMLSL